MKIKSMFALLVAALIITGCATQHPTMTREEWLNTTTRHYEDKTKEEVFSAAEKLFTLSDGNDYTFQHTDDSLYAVRKWSMYFVIGFASGTDNWVVTAKETEKGVKASVRASIDGSGMAPMPTVGGDISAGTIPLAGTPVTGTSLYELFWARMDYLLGKRSEWMTCEEADARKKSGVTWGWNDPLCNSFNVTDEAPTGKKKEPQPEIKSE
ncbi:hypothetical protein NB636_10370 [Oxalobacter aliiformigenes]|uniref:hypothetical protein n=1 Tax=Oxalobacter aliiformigenes TaxID=2946593 RepID=UPI0022B0299E|nr:hypothetical protein [Oxalobacter aliiformigenes]MCZ4065392.1 hypothetical protein [Oxalobacter aliiformigenes]WAV99069.1 hypothetical protein NB636_10370 [Oxalobacter aliiformigenes]